MVDESTVHGDPVRIAALFKEYSQFHRQYVDAYGAVVDKSVDLNNQISLLHERLMLIALGTIGISLSALVSFGSKMSGNPVAKLTFVHYVAPGWVLLFVAAITSRNVMSFVVRINKVLIRIGLVTWMATTFDRLFYHLNRFAKTVSGTVTIESATQDVSTLLTELAKSTQQALDSAETARSWCVRSGSRFQAASNTSPYCDMVYADRVAVALCGRNQTLLNFLGKCFVWLGSPTRDVSPARSPGWERGRINHCSFDACACGVLARYLSDNLTNRPSGIASRAQACFGVGLYYLRVARIPGVGRSRCPECGDLPGLSSQSPYIVGDLETGISLPGIQAPHDQSY